MPLFPYREFASMNCAAPAPVLCVEIDAKPKPKPTPPTPPSFRALRRGIGAVTLTATMLACTPQQGQDAKDVGKVTLDITQTLCVIGQAFLPDPEIATICGIVGPFLGPMHDILAATRTASANAVAKAQAQAHAGACSPDAGTTTPK